MRKGGGVKKSTIKNEFPQNDVEESVDPLSSPGPISSFIIQQTTSLFPGETGISLDDPRAVMWSRAGPHYRDGLFEDQGGATGAG